MKNIYKMSMVTRSSMKFQKGEKFVLYVGENGTKCVYSVQHGAKLVLIVKTNIIFQDNVKTNNKQSSLTTCKNETHQIYHYIGLF